MNFAVVVLACVLAVANAQFNNGQYNAGDQYKYNQYNQYNRYNPYNQQYNRYNPYNQYNQYNRYNPTTYSPFKPFSSTTFAPRPSVTVTEVPAVKVSTLAPILPPVVPVVTPKPVPVVVPVVPVAPVARVAADSRSAETVRYGNDIEADGTFNYFYETNNGIAAQAQGTPRNFGGNPPVVPDVVQGSFTWTSPEGKVVSISYVADENGYQPSGDALPVAPELPPQIARALAYTAKYIQAPVAAASAAVNRK